MTNTNTAGRRDPRHTHVAVLMGGWSSEREVSLASGKAVSEALRGRGFKVTPIDVKPNIGWVLEELKPDVAFNALHGRWGEDGCMQGALESMGLPYTHSGVLASALAMNKQISKALFAKAGIPVAPGSVVAVEDLLRGKGLHPPCVVKPVDDGSSVGVHLVMRPGELPAEQLQEQAELFKGKALVETYIPGRELTCAVMDEVALGVLEIVPHGGFYDYSSKYDEGGSQHICPADLPYQVYQQVQEYALMAHKALGCRGVTRADFRYNEEAGEDGKLYLLEVNTQPGMTPTSLLPDIARQAGHSFADLVTWMVNDASTGR
ncbi:MAG TPA: D-alanine--D-alanine ligase [Thermopetrobacter sp.]|nr:D-alanine--D-alanine ligase [Thermopetrobacter sp.]